MWQYWGNYCWTHYSDQELTIEVAVQLKWELLSVKWILAKAYVYPIASVISKAASANVALTHTNTIRTYTNARYSYIGELYIYCVCDLKHGYNLFKMQFLIFNLNTKNPMSNLKF